MANKGTSAVRMAVHGDVYLTIADDPTPCVPAKGACHV